MSACVADDGGGRGPRCPWYRPVDRPSSWRYPGHDLSEYLVSDEKQQVSAVSWGRGSEPGSVRAVYWLNGPMCRTIGSFFLRRENGKAGLFRCSTSTPGPWWHQWPKGQGGPMSQPCEGGYKNEARFWLFYSISPPGGS